jgi:hypothetical protein
MTIPLSSATLLWNPGGKACSDTHPLNFKHSDMTCSVGAVFSEYRSMDAHEQIINLLVEAVQALAWDDVDPSSMMEALKKIDGIGELFADD